MPPRYGIAKRFKKSGKEKLVLLIVSDFDPDGQTIAKSFARSLRDDFGVENVSAHKVALTAAQVREFKLPPGVEAKIGSATYDSFVDEHGKYVHEVEALKPAELQRLVRDAIDAVLDINAFNRELDQERDDSAFLETMRRRMLAAVRESEAA